MMVMVGDGTSLHHVLLRALLLAGRGDAPVHARTHARTPTFTFLVGFLFELALFSSG